MSSVIVTTTVVGITCIAHETVLDADEIGAVIKAGIAVAAEAVFVLVMFLRALLFSEFEAGSVLFGRHHGGSGGSGSPVVRSVGSHRSCSFVSESGRYHLDKCRKSISILFSRLGKSVDHDKNRKMGGHMSITVYTCHMSHIYLLIR